MPIFACKDRELFAALPMGDCWEDAGLPAVFFYLYKHKDLEIPEARLDMVALYGLFMKTVS